MEPQKQIDAILAEDYKEYNAAYSNPEIDSKRPCTARVIMNGETVAEYIG